MSEGTRKRDTPWGEGTAAMSQVDWRRCNCVVFFIALIFLSIYVNAVWIVIIPWLSVSVPGVLNLVGFSTSTFLAFCSYVCCVVVDAGQIPEDWTPDLEEPNSVIQVKKTTGGARYCQKCDNYKPPRCHHCRICRRCILRMDHHCPWINNCIGHGNYRAFILFLIYSLLALGHNLVLLIYHQHHVASISIDQKEGSSEVAESPWLVLSQLVIIMLTILLMVCISSLLGWHIHLIKQNKTTIEHHEGVTAKLKASKVGKHWRHPYDIGIGSNIRDVFGYNLWYLFLPLSPSLEGDGVFFNIHK